jgi:hypothetical protein
VIGFWERRNWSPAAPIKTLARADVPGPGRQLATPDFVAGGIAFAGDRGIQQVQLSLDLGESWTPAEIEPPRAPLTWVRWRVRLRLPGPGQFQVMVRAVDGTGALQDAVVRRSFPSGATGYHRVLVEWLGPER